MPFANDSLDLRGLSKGSLFLSVSPYNSAEVNSRRVIQLYGRGLGALILQLTVVLIGAIEVTN